MKDRSAWLVVFGCIELLIGGFLLLMLPLTILGTLLSPERPAGSSRMLVPSIVLYLVAAVFFIWVGIGTILKRRWARALMLTASWVWLAVGIASLIVWFFVMQHLDELVRGQAPGELSTGVLVVVKLVVSVFLLLVYGLLPVVFVLFFRSPSVRATIELSDPKIRWTDRCPPQVLSFVLALGYCGVSFLAMLAFGAAPLFGRLLTGLPAAALILASAGVSGYLTHAAYRLRPAAWWGSLFLFTFWAASSALTFARRDVGEMYSAMGLPEDQIEAMKALGMGRGYMVFVSVLSGALLVAYLLYLRRFFRPGAPRAA